jgi:hypothetical protein
MRRRRRRRRRTTHGSVGKARRVRREGMKSAGLRSDSDAMAAAVTVGRP